MKTMTVSAIVRAARTAASVRGRSTACASPGRFVVATQVEANSSTWDIPMMAIRLPLIVVNHGCQAASALVPIPTYGNCAAAAADSVSARPTGP